MKGFWLYILFMLWLKLPSQAIDLLPFPASQLVKHTHFVLSYNEQNEQANWVYYTLTDSMVLNSGIERSNSFRMDKLVKTISAKSSDYTNSGFDRGHLCPAADMGFDSIAMKESFLMSNISPQLPDFNRGIWKELESMVRQWALKENKLHIVTGPIFSNNIDTIGKEEVVVPGFFFKIVYEETGNPKMIAFLFPNQKSNRLITDYVVTTDELEKLSGFDFFKSLPDDLENKLEGQLQLAQWFPTYVATNQSVVEEKPVERKIPSEAYFYLILIAVVLTVVFIVAISRKQK